MKKGKHESQWNVRQKVGGKIRELCVEGNSENGKRRGGKKSSMEKKVQVTPPDRCRRGVKKH